MVTKLSIKTSQTLNDTRGMEKVHSFTNEGYNASERGDRKLYRTIQMSALCIKK